MHFAQELIDHICQNLEDDTATLIACSQASLSWLWASRRAQFRALGLSARNVSNLEDDLAFLEGATFILPNVIHVAVGFGHAPWDAPPNEITLQLWHIERILSLFPNTRRLNIEEAEYLSGSSVSKTSYLKSASQLEALSLCGNHFYHDGDEVECFAAFFSLFTTIRRLEVRILSQDDSPLYPNEKFIKLSKGFSIPSIEHLSLHSVSLGMLHYFAYSTRTHPVKSLDYSDIDAIAGNAGDPIVIEILKACAGHLEAVSIRCE